MLYYLFTPNPFVKSYYSICGKNNPSLLPFISNEYAQSTNGIFLNRIWTDALMINHWDVFHLFLVRNNFCLYYDKTKWNCGLFFKLKKKHPFIPDYAWIRIKKTLSTVTVVNITLTSVYHCKFLNWPIEWINHTIRITSLFITQRMQLNVVLSLLFHTETVKIT